ncbi:MAG: hypothetical protein V3S69_05110, partial [Dehalococcoidales bacterium]
MADSYSEEEFNSLFSTKPAGTSSPQLDVLEEEDHPFSREEGPEPSETYTADEFNEQFDTVSPQEKAAFFRKKKEEREAEEKDTGLLAKTKETARVANILADGINVGAIRALDLPAEFVTTLIEQGSRLVPGMDTIDMSRYQGGFEKMYREFFVDKPELKTKTDRVAHLAAEFVGGAITPVGAVARTSKVIESSLQPAAKLLPGAVPKGVAPLPKKVTDVGKLALTEAKITTGAATAGSAVASMVSEENETIAFLGGALTSPFMAQGVKSGAGILKRQSYDRFTKKGQQHRAIKRLESDLPKNANGEVDYEMIEKSLKDLAKLEADTGVDVVTTTRSVVDNPRIQARQTGVNRKFAEDAEEVHRTAKHSIDAYLKKLDVARDSGDVTELDNTLKEIVETMGERLETIADKIARDKDILTRGLDKKKLNTRKEGIKLTDELKRIQKTYVQTIGEMYKVANPGKEFKFNVSA